jgi:hypothetical protein
VPKHGEDLGVDLYELWVAGQTQLPQVGEQFADAAQWLARTESQDGGFWRPAEFGGGGYGPAQASFAHLRDSMTAIFRDSQDNLELAGRALMMAAEEYASTDHTAADTFHRLQHDKGEGQF